MFDAEASTEAPHAPDAVMVRTTIAQIEAKRSAALASHAAAFDALAAAHIATAATTSAKGDGPLAAHADLTGKTYLKSGEDPRAHYLEHVRQGLDRRIWSHLVDFMGLERVMDRTEREAFRAALAENPPPATAENCASTFARLIGDADVIFRRGIALAFSGLDRRFRSHDGFKIGARIVLSWGMDSSGYWCRGRDETLRDVERTFYTLDGKEQPERSGGIIGALALAKNRAPGRGFGPAAYMAEDDYFRVRVFMNGNVHVWFKRDDLVRKVNELLAEYYGATLGAGADAAETNAAPKTGIAPRFGLFETPEPLARRVLSKAGVHTPETYSGDGFARLRVLEPSAGRGRIALPAARAGHDVVCVEFQPELADGLARAGLRTIQGDFMAATPAVLGLFDAVTMNPPFDRGRDCEHVRHAFDFLKPGGVLVSIMSASVEFREDKRTTDFRAFVERFGGKFEDLPPGSFAESGTNANTVLLTIRAPRA